MFGDGYAQIMEKRCRLDFNRADAQSDPNDPRVFNRSFRDGLHGVPA